MDRCHYPLQGGKFDGMATKGQKIHTVRPRVGGYTSRTQHMLALLYLTIKLRWSVNLCPPFISGPTCDTEIH